MIEDIEDYKKIRDLLCNKEVSNQLIALSILEVKGIISPKVREFLSAQHLVPKWSYLVPNKYIELQLTQGGIEVDFTYDLFKVGDILDELGTIKYLKRANIRIRKDQKLPESLSNSDTLAELSIGSRDYKHSYDFKEVINILSKIENLEILRISDFQIKQFPEEIFKLNKIKKLYLNNNSINHLPKEIGKMSNLEILDIGYNDLEFIPKEISKLDKLKLICLRKNKIKRIPHQILRMESLNYIDLSGNNLEDPMIRKYMLDKRNGIVINK